VSNLRSLLRPAKLRNAVRRRRFEYSLRRTRLTPYAPLVHLGTAYGGWIVPDDKIDSSWLCYCVGAGSDVSFDLALIARYGARVRSFDPFHVFREAAERQAGGDPRFSFHEVAIALADGPIEMFGRQDEEQGAVSAANLYGVRRSFLRPGRSFPSLMAELGDHRIDLLKLDVEGLEYELLPTLDLAGMGVRVLLIELHHNASARTARAHIATLAARGYLPVCRKDPTSFTLLREDIAR
jgi:FkbM family methyltransferase